jgi:signal transduction histidine kinase
MRTENVSALPYIMLFTAVVTGQLCVWLKRPRLGSQLYLASISLAVALFIWANPQNTGLHILLMVPISMTLVLLDYHDLRWVSPLTLLSTALLLATHSTLANTLGTLLLPTSVCIVATLAAMIYGWTRHEELNWARTTQSKDTRRAEMFYDQSEKLERALREVQWYSARLESVNRELEEARRVAESASNAKSTFLSNMSHELRTPLNMVIGYTSSMLTMPQMYQHQPLPEVYRRDIELIQAGGQHLLGLINDVLDLSKIEAGKLELQPIATHLHEIFTGVVATATGLTKDKPVQLRQDIPSELPRVWADPLRVRQILLNLLSNAIKFTDTGSVTLRARVTEEGVHIAVIDTGIGIPEEALKSIFGRFEQVRGQKSILGTGLGLDISQRLAEMHGSTLTVESSYGQGSTFAFVLPLATPEQIAAAPSEAGSRIATGVRIFDAPAAQEQVRTILLVGDESETRTQIHEALEAQHFLVVTTHEGTSALELAQALQPDAVLLDTQVHGMSGTLVLDALAQDALTREIPVIILGDAFAQERPDVPYIPKPIETTTLIDTVQQRLKQPA